MNLTLFIAENCHECEQVVSEVKAMGLEIAIHNVDRSEEKPPIKTFAYPALFKGELLIAYGSDILNYLNRKVVK